MKISFVIYMENMGDGSVCAKFFSSEDAAEKFAAQDDERFCDDIYRKEIEVDENGKLLTPDPVHWKDKL